MPGTKRNYGPVDGTSASAPLTGANDASKSELISDEDAFAFNCVQRGHQNALENAWMVAVLSLTSWSFPIPSGFSLILWSLGRVVYLSGYSVSPSKRISPLGIFLTYPPLFCLWGLSLATAVHLFRGTAPYSLV